MIDRSILQDAAQYPDSYQEGLLEDAAFQAYNGDWSKKELKTLVGQLWFAFVWRQRFMRDED